MTLKQETGSAEMPLASRQKGISLIEAMVAVLLLAILFLGIAHVLSRGLVSQRYMNTQNLALLEMRELLQDRNDAAAFCGSPDDLTWVGSVSLTAGLGCATDTVTISIDGIAVDVTAQSIEISTATSATSQGLFGGDGVITVSDN